MSVHSHVGFPGSSAGKESTCNAGDLSSIPGLGRSPGGRYGNPLQYSCLDNPHGQRSLVGCSPWGRKESDTTEQLHFHALEKAMATHSSVLAWRIPGSGEPGRPPSMGLQSQTRLKQLSSSSLQCHHGGYSGIFLRASTYISSIRTQHQKARRSTGTSIIG